MAPDLDVLVGREAGVVQVVEEPEAAAQGDEGRPTARLGGMGREDEPDGQLAEQRLALCRGVLARQPSDGRVDGTLQPSRGGPTRALAEPPHAVLLLGQVGEVEVQGESAGQVLHLLRGELLEHGAQLAAVGRAAGAPQVDGQATDTLDDPEQVLARLLGDDLAEQRAEQLDLARERVAGPGCADAQRLGAHGGVGADGRGDPGVRGGDPGVRGGGPGARDARPGGGGGRAGGRSGGVGVRVLPGGRSWHVRQRTAPAKREW